MATISNNADKKLLDCSCTENLNKLTYRPHGHVHTGNLDLIKNVSLSDIIKMEARFHGIPHWTKHKLTHLYEEALDKLSTKLAHLAKSIKGNLRDLIAATG